MEYLRIRGGKIAQKATDGTKHAKTRTFVNPKTSEEGTATEVNFEIVTGIITNIDTKDTDWGDTVCEITMEKASGDVFIKKGEFDTVQLGDAMLTVSVGDKSNFNSIAERFPNMNLSKPVTFKPYNFPDTSPTAKKDKEGKPYNKIGVSIIQEGKPVESYYWGKNKDRVNRFPKPDKKMDSDDWKIYFIKVRKFLVGKIEEMGFKPKEDKTATSDDLVF